MNLNLKNWWKKKSKELNKIILEFIGFGVGYVPMTNLIEDFSSIPPNEKEKLIPMMVADGCTIRVDETPEGKKFFLYIK